MKKKKIIRVLQIMMWMAVVAAIAVSVSFVNRRQEQSLCKDMTITLDYRGGIPFISDQDLQREIKTTLGPVTGRPLAGISAESLRQVILNNHYVKEADVMITVNGIIKATVVQRKPVLRIFNVQNQSSYIDEEGRLMALCPGHVVRLLVASGNINVDLNDEAVLKKNFRCRADGTAAEAELNKVFLLAAEINEDDFLKAQIEQIYVDEKGEYELIPKIGHQLIMLGDTSFMQEKLNHLVLFYKNCIQETGWDRYDTISVKFRNQVVCSKI
jgi:cell division protein FtsQ